MGSRTTDNFIREAKLFLNEFFNILKTRGSLSIDELSKELDTNRNFVSAFATACVALDICDIKVTNSKIISIKEELKEKFDPTKYRLLPVPMSEEEK